MIAATTTAGTTLADLLDRSLGIGYLGGTSILLAALLATLFLWHRTLGSVDVSNIASRKAEVFYWATIMFSQTLGTALGDWVADDKPDSAPATKAARSSSASPSRSGRQPTSGPKYRACSCSGRRSS